MLVTAVMGSVLGVMYLATKRNLWPLIAAHATLDAILMTQVYFGVIYFCRNFATSGLF